MMGLKTQGAPMTDQRLSGKRILIVIAPAQYRDEELVEPKKIFLQEGAKIAIASTSLGKARGMLGGVVVPDLTFDGVDPKNYDACVLVGGMGSPTHLWLDSELHDIIRSMDRDKKILGAICLSSAVLAKAGILEGKQATVWASSESLAALKSGGAHYVKEQLVKDGRIITADGPEASVPFANALVDAISAVPAKA